MKATFKLTHKAQKNGKRWIPSYTSISPLTEVKNEAEALEFLEWLRSLNLYRNVELIEVK